MWTYAFKTNTHVTHDILIPIIAHTLFICVHLVSLMHAIAGPQTHKAHNLTKILSQADRNLYNHPILLAPIIHLIRLTNKPHYLLCSILVTRDTSHELRSRLNFVASEEVMLHSQSPFSFHDSTRKRQTTQLTD